MSWELFYDGRTVEFGDVFGPLALAQAPKVTAREFSTEDASLPGSDYRLFGRDSETPGSVQFGLHALASTEAEAKAVVEGFAAAWRGDAIRRLPGVLAELRSPSGRTAFGRPRAFDPDLELVWASTVDVACEFVLADALWYGPGLTRNVALIGEPGAGLVAPLTAPLVAVGETLTAQAVNVAGSVATPLSVKFNGPLTNGRVEIGELLVELSGAIAEGTSVTVDARTRSVLRSGGGTAGSAAGMLTARSTPLDMLLLEPGQHEIVLRGTSSSGTASVDVAWRDAYLTY